MTDGGVFALCVTARASVADGCLQGQTQGQLDKLQEEPNHWTFLTGTIVASLPISRLASFSQPIIVRELRSLTG